MARLPAARSSSRVIKASAMKNVVRRTAVIFPCVGFGDFLPAESCWITFPQSRLDLDERRGLHLDFFRFPSRKSAPERSVAVPIMWWLLFTEDQDTGVKYPPVIPNVDHLAQNLIERVPCAGQRRHPQGLGLNFVQLRRGTEFEGKRRVVATLKVSVIAILDNPGCKPYHKKVAHDLSKS
jgi:hypothetical protein